MVFLALKKCFCRIKNKANDHIVNNDVITVEEGATAIPKLAKMKNQKPPMIAYLIFYSLICLVLSGVYTAFLCFVVSQSQRVDILKVFMIYVITLIVLCAGFYLESLIMKKTMLKMIKKQSKKTHILRVRLENDKDFIEFELEEEALTFEGVLELCCKELSLKKEEVNGIRKIPSTKVRNDNDVMRFGHVEYLELIKN